MVKLSDFFVRRRRLLFVLTLVAAVVCGVLMPFVNVNSDMTKYLPEDSRMKQGIDVLKETFTGMDISLGEVRVMFSGLPDAYKQPTVDALMEFPGVDAVDYKEDNPEYNNGDRTLYKLAVSNSVNQKRLAKGIRDKFGRDVVVETGQDGTTPGVAVLLIAFALLLLILFFMCSSWLEPPIFLFTIGLAVIINIGSNFFLESVSITTTSIVAILQLTLSIDFSIILMNRFRQEKLLTDDVTEAMRNALRNAAPSIVSSAMTTIVGLLMLIFMKLKIGLDMGVVLAKGVLCSLVSIFTVLPAVVLRFDGKIEAARKRIRLIPTDRLAAFSVRFRIPLAILALLIFLGANYMHNLTEISFSTKGVSEIDEYFPRDNAILLVYETEGEETVKKLASYVMTCDGVKSFTSYPTLLLQNNTAEEMADKVRDLARMAGQESVFPDVGMPVQDLFRLVYYAEDGRDASLKIGMHDLIGFLSEEVDNGGLVSSYVDASMAANLGRAKFLTDPAAIDRKMTSAELARGLGADRKAIAAAYSMLGRDNGKMSLREFVSGISAELSVSREETKPEPAPVIQQPEVQETAPAAEEVAPADAPEAVPAPEEIKLTFPEFVTLVTDAGTAKDDPLVKFTNPAVNHKEMPSAEIADFFTMKPSQASMVFTLYNQPGKPRRNQLTPYEFVHFLNSSVVTKKSFSSYFQDWQVARLAQIEKLMGLADSDRALSRDDMSAVLSDIGYSTKLAGYVYDSLEPQTDDAAESPKEDVKDLIAEMAKEVPPVQETAVAEVPEPDFSVDPSLVSQLPKLKKVIELSSGGKTFTSSEMLDNLSLLGARMKPADVSLLYLYYGARNDYDESSVMTLKDLVAYISGPLLEDDRFKPFIDDDARNMLSQMQDQMNANVGMLRGKAYSLAAMLTSLPDESPRTNEFIDNLRAACNELLGGNHYIVGESVMYNEMKSGFGQEMMLVTFLTIFAIFVIVAFTFKSVLVPAFLIMVVMSAVYINVIVSGAGGNTMLYLAYLIVQSILMGATIDYGILFTNYYREKRQTMDKVEAMKAAYRGSIHTIMTSGLIMVVAPGALALLVDDVAISAIVGCLSVGAMAAVVLILFVLPGLLAAFDRIVIGIVPEIKKKRQARK